MTQFIFRAVGEAALLVDLGDAIDADLSECVVAIDAALRAAPPPGLRETVPAATSLLILFDPEASEMRTVEAFVREAVGNAVNASREAAEHVIPVCYEGEHAPDMEQLARRTGLSAQAIAKHHAEGDYRVLMYGFAPGFAYLGGVPEPLAVPRKAAAVRDHKVGSVMIAAGQCIVMPLPMPTGWWVIGRTAIQILRPEADDPFLFKPGDRIRFERIGSDELERQLAR
ncbi:5-oxoprolinase subunit B family protein [Sphingosinicella rhizophila]|uniref:Allophanate hydrolase subunit 1 n=1 Tax=Sphingosinicella rhizophila TaxID=3050082 RepID=A0ABU3Q5T2_9SPHN|nr:allophanate hydrolase subunit 1 [Sphingosinicella sp. GR2756]MDT9598769.1 allophanate hydrolase subunit 1 [Sphingosinicella sp. GR2756]